MLENKAKAKLVDTRDISVNSFKVVAESGVIFLMGRVTQREAATAAEAIRNVSGVQKVVKVFEYIDDAELKNYTAKPQ